MTRFTDHLDLAGPDRTAAGAVLVMALVHDEANLVPSFLDHYRAFGDVTFLIVDDRSSDGTGALLAAQPDVTVLHPRDGSTYSADKREWRGQALDRVAGGRWCLVPDIDEHLVWAGWPQRGFGALIESLEAEGGEALYATMVDMYADAPLAEHVYGGGDLRAAFPFFDDPRKDPAGIWMERAARAFLRDWPTPRMMVRGGMRQRLFQEAAPLPRLRLARRAFRAWDHDPQGRAAVAWVTMTRAFTRVRRARQPLNLTKVPLLRWRAGTRFSGGAHAIRPAYRLARERAALLHYPITRGMAGIEYVVARGQHVDGGSYYRSLLAAGGLNPCYDGSTRMETVDDLIPFVHSR